MVSARPEALHCSASINPTLRARLQLRTRCTYSSGTINVNNNQ